MQTQYADDHEGGTFFSGIVEAAALLELDVAHVDRLREERDSEFRGAVTRADCNSAPPSIPPT